jgi:hypothetical protein
MCEKVPPFSEMVWFPYPLPNRVHAHYIIRRQPSIWIAVYHLNSIRTIPLQLESLNQIFRLAFQAGMKLQESRKGATPTEKRMGFVHHMPMLYLSCV